MSSVALQFRGEPCISIRSHEMTHTHYLLHFHPRRVIIDAPDTLGTLQTGTMYITQGGTLHINSHDGKMVYDRSFLMLMRRSPLSRRPPTGLPLISGITAPATNTKYSMRFYECINAARESECSRNRSRSSSEISTDDTNEEKRESEGDFVAVKRAKRKVKRRRTFQEKKDSIEEE